MPGVATGGNPYPQVNDVMNIARARVGDMLNDTNGDLLTNEAPYAQTYLTAAWRWYQDQCFDAGVETLIRDVVFSGIPARASNDVANQAWMTWLGCSDGVNQYDTPALSQDVIQPLSVWRRRTGVLMFPEHPMVQATDGLPGFLDPNVYDWRDDGLYFYAVEYEQDFRIRYAAYRPDLDITQPTSQVPMMRCANILGARVAFEFANARGAAQAPAMQALADKEFADGPATRTSRRKQRQTIRRRPAFGGDHHFGHRWPIISN